ncbi:MAG: Holliday junction branch migration protein RuvA [Verrucomicrobiota bacterium]|nr:Holliday junction branch migration protein RuvA [Verrucomicrobiota bacterium]MEC8405397.1 Holliday junction branch migration protein RuvA [Verrucomicrobiota bacterium]MEC8649836.1 Holliday junction branch migration protein RuvA [Verrucomicrobiota bacterium]
MIVKIFGTILEQSPLTVVIETGGLGYEVNIPLSTAEKLPKIGKECTLFIHAVYREDSAVLYGFISRNDRDFFRLLVEKVSGIGPKIGISILSRLSVELLQNAIICSDVSLLSKCPGIGKKTAERLVIELKDKVSSQQNSIQFNDSTAVTPPNDRNYSNFKDAVSSLIALGYKPADSDKLIREVITQLSASASVEEIIRKALS